MARADGAAGLPREFADRIACLQSEYFADDIDPPPGAESWRADDLRRFFAEGGKWRPPPLLSWDASRTTGLSAETAHAPEPVSRVQVFVDEGGVLGAAGAMWGLSSSWDASVKLWTLSRANRPSLACELRDASSRRWVYDCAPFWFDGGADSGAALGVVSGVTGGMFGEPAEVRPRRRHGTRAAASGARAPSAQGKPWRPPFHACPAAIHTTAGAAAVARERWRWGRRWRRRSERGRQPFQGLRGDATQH